MIFFESKFSNELTSRVVYVCVCVCVCVRMYVYLYISEKATQYSWYGLATISRLLKNIGLFCRI